MACENFLSIMNRRYACKLYDTTKPISASDVDYILECARLSPSSFGLEHWHLYAVISPEKKEELFTACFSQEAVRTASLCVVAVCRRSVAYAPDTAFVAERGSRFPGGLSVFVNDYSNYYDYLKKSGLLDHWARSQCYIACANMMSGAAADNIDSCAIEGYKNEDVLSILDLDPTLWQTGIITVFGYSADTNDREKIRMPLSQISTYV